MANVQRTRGRFVVRSNFRQRARAGPCIAIVVPFREQPEQSRSAQIRQFAAHMHAFLGARKGRSGRRFVIVVVHQSDDGRKFNRGQLLNIGFLEAQSFFAPHALASVIFHDVDLLPSESLLSSYEEVPRCGRPQHLSCANTWWKVSGMLGGYRERFIGGVTAFAPTDFEACNGFPNDYWGWGLEDDQLRLRADAAGCLTRGIKRPESCAGRYTDIDALNNLNVLQSAGREQSPHLWNRKFLETRSEGGRFVLDLDADWQTSSGLRGLQHTVRARWRMRLGHGQDQALPPSVLDDVTQSLTLSGSSDDAEDRSGGTALLWVFAELGGDAE
jgi:hypothetical protein